MVKLLRIPILRSLSAMTYCVLLSALFLLLVLGLPANTTAMRDYQLSSAQYHILLLIVVIPIVASWFAAFYGYTRIRQYAQSLKKSSDSGAFHHLADGNAWIAWGLPVPAILTITLNTLADAHPNLKPTAIIITNYINLLIPLVAFTLISAGSRDLASRASIRVSLASSRSIMVVFASLGVLFCYLTFRNFDLTTVSSSHNPYFLPIWLVVASITIPYLYAWLAGLLAAYEIAALGKQAKGLLYSKALRLFALGLIAVIASSIALQYVNSGISRTGHLSLNSRLLTTYLIRVVAVVGYLLMADGARSLRKIEEV